ncbi:glycosyl transferase [Sphingobacterium alkalisoli]|nr:glycosyl transferase [Sphingobacterium alkalisoli]
METSEDMNVLYVSLAKGGSSKSLRVLLSELIKYDNFTPYVVFNTRSAAPSFESFLKSNEIQYSCIDFEFDIYPKVAGIKDLMFYLPRFFTNIYKNRIAIRQIVKLRNIFKFDLIHSNTSCFQVGFFSAKSCEIPHLWHFREYQDLDFSMTPIWSFPYLIRKSKSIRNFNIAITKGVFKHFDMQSSNSVVIYNGIEGADKLDKPDIVRKERFFLFAGNVTENKGILEVLRAFAIFSRVHKDFTLRIAGSCNPTFQDTLMDEIVLLGIVDRVIFLGQINDVYSQMKKSTALIVASRFEAFGLITAEAMLNHCLVIGKDIGGTKEQLDNGVSKLGYEIGLRYKTVEDLALQLCQVSENGSNHYSEMIDRAFYVVKELYHPKRYADQVVSLYRRILKK